MYSEIRKCSVINCYREHNSLGLCKRHYQQFRKFGKVLIRTTKDPNEFIIEDNICLIVLYNLDCVEVARAKFYNQYYEMITQYKWCLNNWGYVQTTFNVDGRQHVGLLHQAIIQLSGQIVPYGYVIDHKDRDPLNCLDDNLRICTESQNQHNREKQYNNTSGYKGVYFCNWSQKWKADIYLKNKHKALGSFSTKEEAAKSYNDAALLYHGEFAVLNNI